MAKRTIVLMISALMIVPLPVRAAEDARRHDLATRNSFGLDVDLDAMGDGSPYARINAALTRPKDQGGPGFLPLHPEQAGAAQPTGSRWGHPIPMGDLDGDGSDDLATYESSRDGTVIAARRGTTGEALWKVTLKEDRSLVGVSPSGWYTSWSWVMFADGDGDGASDLLVVTVSPSPWGDGAALGITQRVEAFDGSTGDSLWSWEELGSVVRVSEDAARIDAAQDLLWNIDIAGDVTGDGIADPFLQLCDGGDMTVAGLGVIWSTAAPGCDGIHLDRTTGEIATSARAWGRPTMWPVADLSGDGKGDIVTLRAYSDWFYDVVAMTASGTELWTALAPYEELLWVWGAPLRGGASGDLVLFAMDYDEEAGTSAGFQVHTMNGGNGETLWSRSFDWTRWLSFQDDLDGDGGFDVLLFEARQDAVVTSVYDGRSFRTRQWSTTIDVEFPPGMQSDVGSYHLGDLDGDGATEIAVFPYAYTWGESFALGTRALDGRTGAVLWSLPEGTEPPSPLRADVDGNGTLDLGRTVEDGGSTAIEVMDGITRTPLWRTAARTDARWPYAFAADLTAHPGLELVASWSTTDGNLITGERAGAEIWALSYKYF